MDALTKDQKARLDGLSKTFVSEMQTVLQDCYNGDGYAFTNIFIDDMIEALIFSKAHLALSEFNTSKAAESLAMDVRVSSTRQAFNLAVSDLQERISSGVREAVVTGLDEKSRLFHTEVICKIKLHVPDSIEGKH